jgi:preprotein translocase subunit SecF
LNIDLKGGTQVSLESTSELTEQNIKNVLKDYPVEVRIARGLSGYTALIDFDTSINSTSVIDTLKANGYSSNEFSVSSLTSSLGASFFQQAQIVLAFAFLFMAITVFIIFRTGMPSFYVVLCGFTDIVETLAISQFLGIKLSLATFAALLLLIGYSVDTDILLTSRVLKTAEGELVKKIRGAMKTGMTMIGATAAALVALFVISASSVITEIASVLLIGLIVDILNTWVTNSNLLRWYVERKQK